MGDAVGEAVGEDVGEVVGEDVGDVVGDDVGEVVGVGEGVSSGVPQASKNVLEIMRSVVRIMAIFLICLSLLFQMNCLSKISV